MSVIAVVPLMWFAENRERFDLDFPNWRKEISAPEEESFAAEITLAEKRHPEFKRWRAELGRKTYKVVACKEEPAGAHAPLRALYGHRAPGSRADGRREA